MDELQLIQSFRAYVPEPDEAARRRARDTLSARLLAADQAHARTFRTVRPRWVAAALVVLALVVVFATPAFGLRDGLFDLLGRITGSGKSVETSRYSLDDRDLLRRAGAIGVRGVRLIGAAGPLAYYAVERKDGNTCFVTGRAADRPHIAFIDCPPLGQRFSFPSARTPILDHSVFSASGRLSVLTGIAADGVGRVGVVDERGRVYSTPVRKNVYYTRDLPKTEPRAIVALTATGRRVYTLPIVTPSAAANSVALEGAQAVLRRFMQARIDRDDDTVLGLMTHELRRDVLAGRVDAPTFQVSNPCWYRYELLQPEQASDSAVAERVRIYEHAWAGDVAGGLPKSFEQAIRLAKSAGSWRVDRLGPEQADRTEANEPHGPHTSACNSAPRNPAGG